MITKEHLKHEIDLLDENYLELALCLLQQFPHHRQAAHKTSASRYPRPLDFVASETLAAPGFYQI